MIEIKDYKDKHEFISNKGVKSVVYLMDCMDLLKQIPEKYFELAIVDPPYGIGAGGKNFKNGTSKNKTIGFKENDWDNSIPSIEYFKELKRVSKNQIIWGGNYFANLLENSQCWLFWDKGTGYNSYADGELAWTSFNGSIRKFFKSWVGANANNGTDRIHPTEKPVALYEWLIRNYAKEGDRIIDTHLGSGSSRIAAYKANLPFMGCELDPDYFYASVKRFENEVNQLSMF